MSGQISFVQFSKYDIPKATVDRKNDWVEYGDDNNWFQRLIDARQSTTHGSLLNSITDMIYGRGLYATDATRKPGDYAAMVSLFTEETTRKLCEDYYQFGWAFYQVIKDTNKTVIAQVEHMPAYLMRSGKANEDGEIDAYYFSNDWTQVSRRNPPKRFSAFGTSNDAIEIVCIKPYRAGEFYYPSVEYVSGLPYADLEIELAKYHVNQVRKRFSANTIINFNNGQPPTEEKKHEIEGLIRSKFEGVEGDGIVVAFNDNKDAAATVEGIPLPDQHSMYSFIAEEAAKKIMVSHRVTSGILLGIGGGGGLGSNADELRTAMTLFDNTVIKPIQRVLIEGIQKALVFNGINLNVYMATSQPLETQGVEVEDVESEEEKTDVTGLELKKICCSKHDGDNLDEIADEFIALGEDGENDEWELINESPVDYSFEEAEDLQGQDQGLFAKIMSFVSTGTARPGSKSEQDKGLFKVRYQYAPQSVNTDSREFCKKMVAANKVYRKEDIIAMGDKAVNPGWGPRGANTYSIWFYKGGGNCHHFWMRKVYMRKRGDGGQFLPNEGLANDKEVGANAARRAGVELDVNDPKVAKLPTDMPNNGFLNPR